MTWRIENATAVSPTLESLVTSEQVHVNELQSYSDADLADLGISRGTIRDSVRNGRPGIERTQTDEAA